MDQNGQLTVEADDRLAVRIGASKAEEMDEDVVVELLYRQRTSVFSGREGSICLQNLLAIIRVHIMTGDAAIELFELAEVLP